VACREATRGKRQSQRTQPSLDQAAERARRGCRVGWWSACGRVGHASVSFTLDRYGHLYPEADTALRDRLDALYVTAQPVPVTSSVSANSGEALC